MMKYCFLSRPLFVLSFSFLFFIMLSGCSDDHRVIGEKKKMLLDLHDEEMARMDEIYMLKDSLKIRKDSLPDQAIYDTRIKSLEKAEAAMMDWMHNYQEPDEKVNLETQMSYYDNEFHKMKDVQVKISNSIDSARTLLKQ